MSKVEINSPNSIETERSVLGAILLDNNCIDGLPLKEHHFYHEQNRTIFGTMLQLRSEGNIIDAVTIGFKLGKEGLRRAGGALYISQLSDNCATSAAVEHHVQILIEYSKRREIINTCMSIASEGSGQVTDISKYLSVSRNKIISLIDDTDDLCDSVTATESAQQAYEQIVSGDRPDGLISTGIASIDNMFGGLWPGLLTVLASRPSMGKSCFALNVIANACLHGAKVLLVSLEDTRSFVNWRLMARFANVPIDQILRRKLSNSDKKALETARNQIKCLDLRIIDKGGMTSERIKSACISHANKFGLDLVVIDHLGHINEPGNNLYESTSRAARTIASIAPELNIPVLLLHQLNRAPEQREKPIPKLADLRQSGEIEQLARAVWFLYRPYYYSKNENEINEMDLIVAKNSHGPTDMLQLYCDMPLMHVTDQNDRGELQW